MRKGPVGALLPLVRQGLGLVASQVLKCKMLSRFLGMLLAAVWLAGLSCVVAFGFEQGENFFAEVALNQDLAILGVAPHTAFGFQHFAQSVEVVVGADKACYQRHLLASALLAVESDVQFLLLWRQGLLLLCVVVVLVFKVGIGGIDDAYAIFL